MRAQERPQGSGRVKEEPGGSRRLLGSGRILNIQGRSIRVQEGPGGSGRVPEGPGGSSRVQVGLEVWEGSGGFVMVREGLEGSWRVQKGLGVSWWVPTSGRVYKGPEGSGMVQNVQKGLGGCVRFLEVPGVSGMSLEVPCGSRRVKEGLEGFMMVRILPDPP